MKSFSIARLLGTSSKRHYWLAAASVVLAAYFGIRSKQSVYFRENVIAAGRRPPRIVVLGSGFAGLAAARRLYSLLRGSAEITIVDRHNYHLFTPMLFQVATCEIDPYDIAYPIHHFANRRGVAFRKGIVSAIDLDQQQIHLHDGVLPYDYLIVALGSTTDFYGNRSAMEHALPMKTLEDAVAIRNHVLDLLERASVTAPGPERSAMLSFVVVGGGATGVETAAALRSLLRQVVPANFPAISRNEPSVLLLESERKLLGHMSDRLADHALRRLRSMGVQVLLGARAGDVSPDAVATDDGRSIPSRTVIWAAGVRCPDVVAQVAGSHGKGGSLDVDRFLRVAGRHGVYAIGDNAHLVDLDSRTVTPMMAAAAVQEGSAVGENVARAITGRPQVPFHYRALGEVLSLGRASGAVEFGNFVIDGFLGWLAWRLVHLARITSLRNKIASTLDWAAVYLHQPDTSRLDLSPTREAEQEL